MRILSRRAESLIESMIAVTVIALSTTAALGLIRASIAGNQVIAEKVVALNLAQEGIEAVINIRDTNFLKFPSAVETCWNAIGASDLADCDEVTDPIERMGDYISTDYALERLVATADSVSLGEPRFQWVLDRSGETDITLYSLPGGVGQLYAQSGITETGYGEEEIDAFTRTVVFDAARANEVDVTVTVGWTKHGTPYEVSLSRTIANIY